MAFDILSSRSVAYDQEGGIGNLLQRTQQQFEPMPGPQNSHPSNDKLVLEAVSRTNRGSCTGSGVEKAWIRAIGNDNHIDIEAGKLLYLLTQRSGNRQNNRCHPNHPPFQSRRHTTERQWLEHPHGLRSVQAVDFEYHRYAS